MKRPVDLLTAEDLALLAGPMDSQSNPVGIVIRDGRVRVLGYSEPLPDAPSQPRCIAACGIDMALAPGRYGWCSCGYSETQPFCDHSHRLEEHATNRKSYKFEVLEKCVLRLCACKRTAYPPLCDGCCLEADGPPAAR